MQDEIFGPVLVSMTFRTPEEAVALANNSRYGLAATVWTENVNLALDMAPKLRAGVVWVNGTNMFDAAAGFGGMRESGFAGKVGARGFWPTCAPRLPASRRKRIHPFAEPNEPAVEGIDRTAKLYIGGKQARPDGGYSRAVWSPKGRLLGHTGLGNRKDIRNAVEAAHAAKGWAKAAAWNRAQVLYYLAENLSARATEFAGRLHDMTGRDGSAEVEGQHRPLVRLRRLGRQMGRRRARRADPRGGAGDERTRRRDRRDLPRRGAAVGAGVAGRAADGAGLPIGRVPSEAFPLAATDLYQVLDTSDVPGGVVNIVTGSHAELAKPLASHLDVDAVWCFSSSDLSGLVEREAAGNIKRTWLSYGRTVEWATFDVKSALRAATEVKTVWVPYGE